MDDQDRNIHLREISVDFIKTRPTPDLELVFKDDAGVTHKSNKFKNGVLVHWNVNIYVRTHTRATLTLQRALFKIKVAEISVEFKPHEFGDFKVVRLEDSNHCVTVTFMCGKSKSATFPNIVPPMHTHRRIPDVQFRVLIIGRANSGKTSVLQRICETTESPVIYRGNEMVTLDPSMDRSKQNIDDELVFSNHRGYVFHDSRGIESGSTEEIQIVQEFIRRKCRERQLQDRLHAIWFELFSVHAFTTDGHVLRCCVPMDNQRPQLDLKYINDICPDKNVPVIVVFTKCDQFRRNVQIHLEDFGSPDDNVSDMTEKLFQEHYLRPLGDNVKFVRLEKIHRQFRRCDELIEKTAAALNYDVIASMLSATQRDDSELSVNAALNR